MPEILTESFCERCGTRYTFESASPRGPRLKGLRTVSRGFRNFVMSDDTSLDEAMAAARNETEREATSQQLDAFHKTFNFCMSCRQYTCGNCWNDAEGRCLSCAPHLGQEVAPSPFPNLETGSALPFGLTIPSAEDQNGHEQPETQAAQPMAWPTSDLMREEEQAAVSFETVLAEHEADREAEVTEDAAELADEVDPLARLAAWGTEPRVAVDEPLDAGDVAAESVEPLETVEVEAVEVEPAAAYVEPEPEGFEPEPVAFEPGHAAFEPEPVAAAPEPVAAAPEPIQESAEPAAVEEAPAWPLEPEPVAASATAEPEPEAEPERGDRAAAAAAQTSDLFRRFSAGQSLDDAIAAYELAQAAADALAETPQSDEAQPAAQTAPEPEPEPVAASLEPEPEPVAAAPERIVPPAPEPEAEPIAAIEPPLVEPQPADDLDRVAATAEPIDEAPAWPTEPEPEAEPVAAERRDDVVPQPTWSIVAPETPPEPEWPAQPQWPAQPEWPPRPGDEGLAFLGRPAQPTGGIDALWAESAREVANASTVATAAPGVAERPTGVQPCVSCGLSLSANARFCRRCGSRQG